MNKTPAWTMFLELNLRSDKPLYRQVVDQIKWAAVSSANSPGRRLPSIRRLAAGLAINRNTVAKAYAELESEGIIGIAAGKGCFLKCRHSPFKRRVRRQMLADAIDGAVLQAHHFQVGPGEFLKLAREHLEVHERGRRANATKAKR